MEEKSHGRKVLLINRPFQVSFLKHVLLLALIVLAIFYSALYYLFYSFRKQGLEMGLEADNVFFRFIDKQQFTMDIIFGITMVITVIVIVAYGLLLSNRVAGPLHRLKTYLEAYKKSSEFHELKFREGDYFPDVADAVNDALRKSQK